MTVSAIAAIERLYRRDMMDELYKGVDQMLTMRSSLLALSLALALSAGASAETYRWIDSSGQANVADTLPSGNVKNLRATSRDNDRQSSNSKGTTPTPT
ncbi:MAG: DUF4124 domain-containing protein, partial [Desulfobulbus sp.]|nr:DUF4124 domain-containing protein [Desulfobulbus sp.]